jgi:golgi-specific brefeldin A-resistance guanine nucleotide exchange factor 1
MSSGGYLAPPREKPEQEKLWVETWKRLGRFLPDLFGELFPEDSKQLPALLAAKNGEAKSEVQTAEVNPKEAKDKDLPAPDDTID